MLLKVLFIFQVLFFSALICSYFDFRGYVPLFFGFICLFFLRLKFSKKHFLKSILILAVSVMCFSILYYLNISSRIGYFFYWIFILSFVFLAPSVVLVQEKKSFSLVYVSLIYLFSFFNLFWSFLTIYVYNYFGADYTSLNPNLTSFIMSFQFVVFWLLGGGKFRAIIFLTFFVVILSLSRTAILFSIFTLMIFSSKHFFNKFIKYLLIAIFLTIFFLFFNSYFDINIFDQISHDSNLSRIIRFKGDLSSDEMRFVNYPQLVFNILEGRFFWGSGFGIREYYSFLNDGEDLHSFFLVALSDIGFFGISVFCLGVFLIYKNEHFRIKNYIFLLLIFSNFVPFIFLGSPLLTISFLLLIPCFSLFLSLETKN